MSDVVYSINATLSKSALSQAFLAAGITADCSVSGLVTQTLTPGTAAATTTEISTATLTSVGLFFARNLHTSSVATVSFGQLSGGVLVPTVSLRGGEAAFGRLAAGSYAAKADLPNTKLVITIIEG